MLKAQSIFLAFLCILGNSRDLCAAVLQIRGVVHESGTSQPIGQAEVACWMMPSAGVAMLFPEEKALARIKTDDWGAFHITVEKPGRYHISVKKAGYVPASNMLLTHVATVSLTDDQPTVQVKLSLARPGEIAGQILDEDTKRPVTDVRIYFMDDLYFGGRRILLPRKIAAPDREGRFSASLVASNYLLQVRPSTTIDRAERILTSFSPDDVSRVSQEYEPAYWPGGLDVASAGSVTVRGGERLDLGMFAVRKTLMHSVRFSFPDADCRSDEITFMYRLNDLGNGMEEIGQAPCGRDVLVRGFLPGSYRMQFVAARSRESRVRGSAEFDVRDEAVNVPVVLSRGIEISGRVLVAEGATKPPLGDVRIRLASTLPTPWSEEVPAVPDDRGNFRFSNAEISNYRLKVQGLPSSYYVKEVRYNGSSLTSKTLAVAGGSMAHLIEIVVDDKAATVMGTVTLHDRPAAGSFVVLASKPTAIDELWPIPGTAADEDGRFRFSGLAPGKYSILAVPSDSRSNLERPNVLENLLRKSKTIDVGTGTLQTLTLERTELP